MHVHVVARRDRLRGEADDLVVAMHRLTLGHGAHGDLVPGGDAHCGAHVLLRHQRAGGKLGARDDDVVVGMQTNGEIDGLQHGATSSTDGPA